MICIEKKANFAKKNRRQYLNVEIKIVYNNSKISGNLCY